MAYKVPYRLRVSPVPLGEPTLCIAAMQSNWASDYVVNNLTDQVVDASKGRIQSGTRT